MNKLLSALLLAGAALAGAGCGSRQAKKPKLAEIERVPRLETVMPLKRQGNAIAGRDYTFTVEPLEKADLYTQVRGVVRYLAPNAEIGQAVRGAGFTPAALARGVGLGGSPHGAGPLGSAAELIAERVRGDVLIVLDVPDVVAERDNKRAMLELALDTWEQAARLREVAAEEVKEAQAQKKRYQADVEFRDLQHQRAVRLVSQDTIQKQMAEETRLQHKSALAAVEAVEAQVLTKYAKFNAAAGDVKVAESKVKVARTELERLDTMLRFATVRAPFDGVVTRRWVDRGATVKDFTTPLLTVMRTDVVRVLIDVPERDVPYVRARTADRPGNAARLSVPALQEKVSDDTYAGEVTYTSSSLDPVTRTMRVEILVANPAGHLKSQMTGTATMFLQESKDRFTVPSSALVRQDGKTFLYQIADAKGEGQRGVVRRTLVEVGLDDGHMAGIRSPLTGREQIITKGNGVVREGDFAIAVPAR